MTSAPNPAPPAALVCSWCGKTDVDGRKIVAGPDSNICEACVRLVCAVLGFQLVTEEAAPEAGGGSPA